MLIEKAGVHIDEVYLNHVTPDGHPERGDRIQRLLEHRPLFDSGAVARLPAERRATRDELLLAHTPEHIGRVSSTAGKRHVMIDPDTHTSEFSYETALLAVGGVLEVIDTVMRGDVERGMALVRPPGHHAEDDRAMGFCLFNNVAVAARYLTRVHGLGRVLVVDWDVHHGNGTQQILYEDGDALFVSMHQFPCYPGTGSAREVGSAGGEGFTVNLPMPPGSGDDECLAAFHSIVLPIAEQFEPEFVLISAGFDAHRDDPLASLEMTEVGYAAMTSGLLKIADRWAHGRCAAVLEGGYDLEALARSVETVVRRMSGGTSMHDGGDASTHALSETLDEVFRIQSRYWRL